MQITAVDQENNLFRVENVFSKDLVDKVLATDWNILPWQRQEGQEQWKRRRVINSAILWIDQWDQEMRQQWNNIEMALGMAIQSYSGTAFWIDEPGFECSMHTDGEMPGSLHLTWAGTGTSFYWHNNVKSLRYQAPSQPNCGYIMINQADETGYRRLLWHAMPTPVELNTLRLTTYTWITPK
jgi:hypothetical protein